MLLINYVIIGYLLATLVIGVLSSSSILSYKVYIIGTGRYSFWMIAGTSIATLVGGARTIGDITKVYEIGLIYVIANSFNIISHIITAKFIVSKIRNYDQVHSISEIMGIIYGKQVRCVTALFGTILCFGIVGMQILAMSILLKNILGAGFLETVIYSMLLMVFYSMIGGTHAVIITDIFQLLIIAIAIPTMLIISVSLAGGVENIIYSIPSKSFNIFPREDFINYVFLAVQYVLPTINPAIVQRILISEKDGSARIMYSLAFVECLLLIFGASIGFVLLTLFPEMSSDEAFTNLVNTHFPEWLRILVIIGFLSITMSTADSFLNKAAVLFIHDFTTQLISLEDKTKLLLTKIFTLFAGLAALVVALKFKNIMDMRVYFLAFFSVTVMVPFLFGIFAKKIDKKLYFFSIILGLLFVMINNIWVKHSNSYVYNVLCIFITAIPFICYLGWKVFWKNTGSKYCKIMVSNLRK